MINFCHLWDNIVNFMMSNRFDYNFTCPEINKNIESIKDNIYDMVESIFNDIIFDRDILEGNSFSS